MVTALLAGALALGVPAASAKSVIVAKKTVTVAGLGRSGTALAVCPKGTQAAAGGYSQAPPANLLSGAASLIDVSDSFRQSSRSWTVTGTQVNGGSGALTAYAYCLRNMPKIRPVVVTRPLDAAARSQATVTAPCPGKTKVVSGGYRKPPFSGGSFVFLLDNERAGLTSWKVTAVRGSVGSLAVGKVYSVAYCAAGVKISKTIASANLPVTAAPSSPTAVSAPKCEGAQTFAGGFRSPFVTGGADRGAFLATDALLRQKKWQVSGLTFGGPGAVGLFARVSVLGYCR
jgi:hypothetical protein